MSKSLLKLVDYSIIPAILIVLGKLVGVIAISKVLDFPVSVKEYSDSLFSITPIVAAEDLVTLTSYSDLVMYILIASYFTLVLFQTIFLKESSVKPTLKVKLSEKNLLSLIRDSYDIYHSAAISLAFLWVASLLIFINILIGNTYAWVGAVAFIGSTVLTLILLQDVYREIDNIRRKPGNYQWI